MKIDIYTSSENHVIGGCALNHGLEKVRARGKGPCAKVWDVRARWLCTVRDSYWPLLTTFVIISSGFGWMNMGKNF